jgi:CxxC motif-containing protein (DUF1111 family)
MSVKILNSVRTSLSGCFSYLAILICLVSVSTGRGETGSLDSFETVHSSQRPANARSCAECHSTPGAGGSSRRTVMRAGSIVAGKYVGVPDGGILHAINYDTSSAAATIHGTRVTLNLMGDGYVEAVSDGEFQRIAREQGRITQGKVHGEIVYLTPSEKSGVPKVVGRFGWKAQHSSLLDASADALLNEIGMPNRIFPHGLDASVQTEGASQVPPGVTPDNELDAMVRFIRSTEPVTPDSARSATGGAQAGSRIFDRIGCSICHVRTLKTVPPGTRLRGANIVVSKRLGNKEIHPFSDYLLHDIGTGDGIVQNIRPEDYAQSTAKKFRTAPLWGVRFRLWMMHDGTSLSYNQAIMRHRGEALEVTLNYVHLTLTEKKQLQEFLDSL